jgi:DNA-binding NarL/FixJ family response regulator
MPVSPPCDTELDHHTRPLRVVLADGHSMMRSTLARLIDAETDLHVVEQAADLASAVQQSRRLRPDVLVLDLSLLAGSGRAALARLRDALPWLGIVAVTMDDSARLARHSLAGGASAFVVKDRADRELPDAVRGAARRCRDVGPRVGASDAGGRAARLALS